MSSSKSEKILRKTLEELFAKYGTLKVPVSLEILLADLKLPQDYILKDPSPLLDFLSFERDMEKLNWGTSPGMFTMYREGSKIYHYILDSQTLAPTFDTVYHGTSAAFHQSIQKKGLDSGESLEVNPGAMSVTKGVACTTDYEFAKSFAINTCRSINENKDLVQSLEKKGVNADQHVNVPIVYQWKHSRELKFGEITTSDGKIPATALLFTTNKWDWYPADKFNIKIDNKNKIDILPNYENKEIIESAEQIGSELKIKYDFKENKEALQLLRSTEVQNTPDLNNDVKKVVDDDPNEDQPSLTK